MEKVTAKIEFDPQNKEVINLLMKIQSLQGVKLIFENDQEENEVFARILYNLDKTENYLSEKESEDFLNKIGVL